MDRTKLAYLLIFLFLLSGTFGFSQQATDLAQDLKVIANQKDMVKDIVRATGNVRIEYKNLTLFADFVEVNTETKDVLARGNVVVHLPGEVISMDELQGNLDSGQGFLEKVHGQVQPTLSFEAENVERENDQLYHFGKSWITSCAQPIPRWKFTCSKATLQKEDHIDMWNPVLYIKKIPVFYLPYIRYPLNRERSTGFLMPTAGYNGQKGFNYTQSFFWAIRRNMDATFSLNYYAARGVGGNIEYRYILPKGIAGYLNLYYFRFKESPETAAAQQEGNAYIIRFNHIQPLPFSFRLVADVDYQSSYDFLREFDNNFHRAVVSNRSSQAYLSRSWSYFNWNVRVSRFETYYKQNDNSIIRINMPEMGFTASKLRLFDPVYFSFRTSFNRWEYGWETDYEKNEQRRSQSFFFSPTVSMPFTAIPWMTLNSSVGSQMNYYFQSYEPGTRNVVNEPLMTLNHNVSFEFIGPVFSRIFFDKSGTAKVKHIIEPNVAYRYESPVSASDRIITPRFYYRDHYLSYGLTNHVLIKDGKMSREVFSFSVGQRYYLEPEVSPLQNYLVNGEIPSFSDVTGSARYYPLRGYSLDFSAGYNIYENSFSRLRIGANMGTPADDLFLRINWYKSTDPFKEVAAFSRHQINFFTGVKFPRIRLKLDAEIDYNIQEKQLLYTAFGGEYNYQCLDFRADVRIFYYRDKPEMQFNFSFGIGNIGFTPDPLGGLGF